MSSRTPDATGKRPTAPPRTFKFRVSSGAESSIVDLVADPSEVLETPRVFDIGAPIHVDAPHEILVNKLCALLGRAELRDLIDLENEVQLQPA